MTPRQVGPYKRDNLDFYVEPPWAIEALFQAEPFMGRIWDCAAGTRTIEKVASKFNYVVVSSDVQARDQEGLIGGINFLDDTYFHREMGGVENIVTNPPYGQAMEFVDRALDIVKFKAAFLLRLDFLESQKRGVLFDNTPLARVLVFRRRVSMPPGDSDVPPSGGRHAFAWYVWQHDHVGPPTLGWLK